MNTAGSQAAIPVPMDGKLRDVQVNYIKRYTEDEAGDTFAQCFDPNAVNTTDNYAFTVAAADFLYADITFSYTEDQIRQLIEDQNSFIAYDMLAQYDAISRKMNQAIINYILANFGNYSDGTNSGSTPLALGLMGASNNILGANYVGETKLKAELIRMRQAGTKALAVGMGTEQGIFTYTDVRKVGTANLTGIDLASPLSFALFADDQFALSAGDPDYFATIEPGAIQLLSQIQYPAGTVYNKVHEGIYIKDTVVDPYTMVTYDRYMEYDPRCGLYKGKLSSFFKPQAMFPDNFKATDYLNGVNYITQWDAKP